MPVSEWLIDFEEIGKSHGHTPDQIAAYGDFIKLCHAAFERNAGGSRVVHEKRKTDAVEDNAMIFVYMSIGFFLGVIATMVAVTTPLGQ